MSTHKHFNKICVVAVVLALIITVIFMNGEALGIEKIQNTVQYENRLFDTSSVHTIDIVMNDWSGFIENCENEEYETCSVVIDGEAFRNVAIRAKGNTSLSMVSSSNSDRYSFKIEFDHYDSTNTYYGLDKLSLNNIIQDNTYMKDYLVYRMMGEFGVAAPLCSFVNITVNGEAWGLYLAVEAIEDSFLKRNYGNEYGELYKPDSMSFGGGRGNGKGFDMEAFLNSETDEDAEKIIDNAPDLTGETEFEGFGEGDRMNFSQGGERPEMPKNGENSEEFNLFGESAEAPDMNTFNIDEDVIKSALEEQGIDTSVLDDFDFENATPQDMQNLMEKIEGVDMEKLMQSVMSQSDFSFEQKGDKNGMGDMGDMGGMGSDDVKLKYIDDNASSYSNIFNNAKTDVSDSDKERLIEALKRLSENEDIENTVSVDEVIKYFVVHNYVCNGDSYTGSMIHNYYLRENNGILSMIPWDYNLSFGTFQSSDATSTVNSPIDTPVSGGSSDDRPMLDWIFESEEYTEKYHQYFSDFLNEINITEIIEETRNLISSYVESDPSAFCSFEEFQKGVDTLLKFCELRSESVKGQLSGEIPSTTEAQNADSSKFVDASEILISDMGTMGHGDGDKDGGFTKPDQNTQTQPENESSKDATDTTNTTAGTEESTLPENGISGELNPQQGGENPNMPDGATPPEMPEGMTPPEMPEGGQMPGGSGMQGNQQNQDTLQIMPGAN